MSESFDEVLGAEELDRLPVTPLQVQGTDLGKRVGVERKRDTGNMISWDFL